MHSFRPLYRRGFRNATTATAWGAGMSFGDWVKTRPAEDRALLQAQRFNGEAEHAFVLLPRGPEFEVVCAVKDAESLSPWCLATLAEKLPTGTYKLANGSAAGSGALGWLLAQHRFDTYRSKPGSPHDVFDTVANENLIGPKAVAVPGSLKAWCETLRNYGTISLADVMQLLGRFHGVTFRLDVRRPCAAAPSRSGADPRCVRSSR